MGLLDYLREQLNPPNSLLDRKYVDKYQEWQPEAKRVGGQALEAPMFAPDDLIGTGIPSKLATLLAPALKTAAVGAAPLATMGLLSKAAEQKGVTTVANKLAQALDGQAGAIAWHGSPHKFDKFDLAKIGTGEGAQAYGHGLYLAEAPAVAQEYADALGKEVLIKGKPAFRAKDGTMAGDLPVSSGAAGHLRMNDWDLQKAIKDAEGVFVDTGDQWFAKVHKELSTLKPEDVQINRGQMYKTDIPDEAVARFLDWDKPLSQQEGVLESLKKAGYGRTDTPGVTGGYYAPKTQEEIDNLIAAGIPGIRYLDGGSRSAGQGSSNFVVFDPEMIRILERNGQATGAQPWKPGEWGGLLGSP